MSQEKAGMSFGVASRISFSLPPSPGGKRNFLGPALGRLRVSKGLTQLDVCAALQRRGWDVSRQVLHFVESGQRILSDIELLGLLDVLGASPSDMEAEFAEFVRVSRRRD